MPSLPGSDLTEPLEDVFWDLEEFEIFPRLRSTVSVVEWPFKRVWSECVEALKDGEGKTWGGDVQYRGW